MGADESQPRESVDEVARLREAAHLEEATAAAEAAAPAEASQEVMHLLSEHVPLALLADLALPDGPASPQILSEEGLPDVEWWETAEDADDTSGTGERAPQV